MGSVIAKNLLEDGGVTPNQIKVLKRTDTDKIPDLTYIKNTSQLEENYQADLVFIAVKPQVAQEILTEFVQEKIITKNTIFVSILAGKKMEFFENIIGQDAKIIRSMPNLPIEYSQGILPYLSNKNISENELEAAHNLFKGFGLAFHIKDESAFDSLTALFGSGPGYLFLLQEIFTEIALSFGVEQENASKLVKKLFLGSALMSNFSKDDFTTLRESVTSKEGVTDAGLKVLRKDNALKTIFVDAIDAAVTRSKEI